MLFPRFSLRAILGSVTGLCLFFVVLSFAARGQTWAVAVSMAGSLALVMALTYAVLFFFAWILSLPFGGQAARVESPFAGDRLPPVLVEPPPDPLD
jgi:hypothetical protein